MVRIGTPPARTDPHRAVVDAASGNRIAPAETHARVSPFNKMFSQKLIGPSYLRPPRSIAWPLVARSRSLGQRKHPSIDPWRAEWQELIDA